MSDPATAEGAGNGVLGVILAGGRSSRMGGIDKGDMHLAGKPMLAHVIARFAPQVERLVLNAGSDRYRRFDLPRAPDPVDGQPGPLAGLLAAMQWGEIHAPHLSLLATAPVDAPFLPWDIVARLSAALTDQAPSEIAFALSPAGPQPVFMVARRNLMRRLQRDLEAGDASRVGDWIRRQAHVAVPFPDEAAFANINAPADLAEAEARLAAD